MKKLSFLSLIFVIGSAVSHAQVNATVPSNTVTIPAATASTPGVVKPGPTMKISAGGVLDCVAQDSYNPTTGVITIGGVTLTNVSFTSVSHTGSPAPANGNYLLTYTNGVQGTVPYVAPTYAAPIYIPVALSAVNKPISPGLVPTSVTFPIPAGTNVQSLTVSPAPGKYPGVTFAWQPWAYVSIAPTATTAGQGIAYVTTTIPGANFPGMSLIAKVN